MPLGKGPALSVTEHAVQVPECKQSCLLSSATGLTYASTRATSPMYLHKAHAHLHAREYVLRTQPEPLQTRACT